MALSTKPYKGARDFYPEDKRRQKYTFAKWRSVCESFGYEEYDAPILEPLSIYLAKTGDEIINEQTYNFEDRGGREVVIRPEMTPTVSRMVAARRQELVYPLRWYSIPNLWRYERPQRGRLREHWQLNVDVFGLAGIEAETEIISLADAIFQAFNAKQNMYEIKLNHRQLVDYLLSVYLGLNDKAKRAVSKLIDRINKMERPIFISKLDECLTSKQREDGVTEKLLSILEAKKLNDLPKEALGQPATKQLRDLMDNLEKNNVKCIFDGSLMRGFDYYTGIIFEVFDTNPDNNRSMLGGGRYDGLVGLFGVKPVPTVGFGWGDVTLDNFLKGHDLMPHIPPEIDLYVALIGEVGINAQPVISRLRGSGINVAADLSGRKIGDQLKAAAKKNLKFVLIIGEEELSSKKFNLKNLESGEEVRASQDKIIEIIKAKDMKK
jgi:histidyl-tRNA synthetase